MHACKHQILNHFCPHRLTLATRDHGPSPPRQQRVRHGRANILVSAEGLRAVPWLVVRTPDPIPYPNSLSSQPCFRHRRQVAIRMLFLGSLPCLTYAMPPCAPLTMLSTVPLSSICRCAAIGTFWRIIENDQRRLLFVGASPRRCAAAALLSPRSRCCAPKARPEPPRPPQPPARLACPPCRASSLV